MGGDEARAIAGHLKRVRIPIDKVYASPLCRTLETGMLAFGMVENTPAARGGPLKSVDPKRYDGLKQLLSTPPVAGRNNAVASHGNPFYGGLGPPYLAEGEIAVVRPGGRSGYAIAAKIKLEDWLQLQ